MNITITEKPSDFSEKDGGTKADYNPTAHVDVVASSKEFQEMGSSQKQAALLMAAILDTVAALRSVERVSNGVVLSAITAAAAFSLAPDEATGVEPLVGLERAIVLATMRGRRESYNVLRGLSTAFMYMAETGEPLPEPEAH